MSDNEPDFNSYLPEDFEEQLDRLITSQGTDTDLGQELQQSIMDICREVNDALTKSFSDISKTGFELEVKDKQQGDSNE
ncbi:hypothetical protein ACJJIW_14915 [Microbulbifer sp. JMSA004]|uniref:hypothetical protein n=1 Tax=unclassified Microbulbifer TaxID=2619833 RepID=UPI0024ADE47F|nr:hypothetical protein [Microbulbifer sp. VAAF005]WHI47706.1 hypothetical protein P0078_04755 [Microbulbifer sp. VAAF005]